MLMYEADSFPRKVPLSALISYTWHSALWSAILELDPNKVSRRLCREKRAFSECRRPELYGRALVLSDAVVLPCSSFAFSFTERGNDTYLVH